MADTLNDIVIKITPDLEIKQYEKHLQDLADKSKSAMEKAFRSLDKTLYTTMQKSVNNPKIDFTGEWENQISKFLNRFKEVQSYMQKTGFLPEGMNSGLYQAYANVDKLYRSFVATTKEAQILYEDSKTVTQEYTNWKTSLDNINTSYTNMLSNIGKLDSKLASASEAEDLKENLGPNADILVDSFTKVKDRIAEAENEYLKLKADLEASQEFWSRPGRTNLYNYNAQDLAGETEAGKKLTDDQREALRAILELQEKVNQAEANYKGKEKALNFYAKQRELLEQIYALNKQSADNDGNVKSVEQLAQELSKAEEEAEKLKAKLDEMREDVPTQYQYNVSEEYEKAVQHVKDLKNELVAAATKANELEGKAKNTGSNFTAWRVALFSAYRVLGSINTVASDVMRSARRIANIYKTIWNTVKKVVGAFKSLGKTIRGTADEHAKSFKKMLRDILRYSLGIRSLFMLFRRLRKYIKEAFTEMANQIPEVNAMLASLKSSLYALKGSLATAFEPILSAIAPALVRLIDLLAQAITYVGMFFAALTGRGFVYKAKKVAQTIGDTAKAAKDLNKQLQGFDELNNLTSSNGSGGAGDTPLAEFEKVDVPKWIEDLANKMKQLWNDIMGPIKDAWAKVGDYVVTAWKRAFSSLKGLLSDIVRDFVKAWQSGLGEIISTRFFEIIGDIGNIIANIATALREAWNANDNGLKIWTAILNIVEKILTGIRNITIDIVKWTAGLNLTPAMTAFREWLESLVPVAEMVMKILFDLWNDALKPILTWAFDGENSGIAKFFGILKDFNDKLDKGKIVNDLDLIWKALGRFGINIGEGLLMFMERMLGYLADWLNSDDFTEWCQKVADFLDSIKPEDLADDLEQVWRIIKNIAEWAWKAIKVVIDNKDKILDTLETASEHLDAIAAVFIGGKLLMDIGRLLINLAVFGGSLSKIFGGIGGSRLFQALSFKLSEGVGNIGKSIGNIGTSIANAFKSASVQAELSGAGSLLSQVFLGDFTANLAAGGATAGLTIAGALVGSFLAAVGGYAVGNKLGEMLFPDDAELYQQYAGFEGFAKMMVDLWDAIKYSAEEAGKGISTAFSTASDWIKEKWNGLGEWFTEKWNSIAEWFKINVTDPLKMMFSDAWQSIKDTWNGIKEFFQPLADFLSDLWEGATSRISKFFEGCWLIIRAIWKVVSEWFTENVIDPLVEKWEKFKAKIEEIWTNVKTKTEEIWNAIKTWIETNIITHLTTAWNKFKDELVKIWETATTKIREAWQTTYNWLKTNIIDPMQRAWEAVSEAVKKAWENAISRIKEAWNTVCNWMKSTIITPLQNAWKVCTDAIGKFFTNLWESIKSGAKSAINWVLSRIESAINGMIDSINGFFGLFNHVVSWAADLLDEDWSGVEPIGHINIPRLAQGAVIPPNNEFLAVLGDQKRGTNIEAPLDTMVQAFNMANKGGNEQEIALLQEQNQLLRQLLQKEFGITQGEIFRSVINQNRVYKNATGVSALA